MLNPKSCSIYLAVGKVEVLAVDLVEFYVSRAEIFYKEGKVEEALEAARLALKAQGAAIANISNSNPNKATQLAAIRIFIARALAKLGRVEESNQEYRALIDEGIYLPPIILGLLHNNLGEERDEKVCLNLDLMKLFFS